MENFYAAFMETQDKEIAAFQTERERDDWVGFRDGFSKEFGVTPTNAIFTRIALTREEADSFISEYPHTYTHTCACGKQKSDLKN